MPHQPPYLPLRLVMPGTKIKFQRQIYIRIKCVSLISKESVNLVHLPSGELCYIPEESAIQLA